MAQNIIEYWREQVVSDLFSMSSFNGLWTIWRPLITTAMTPMNGRKAYNAGDRLFEIFRATGNAGRSQSDLSASGAAWEALVCWYLNYNLIGRRTIVIKHKDEYVPQAVSDAITVKYGTTKSNTESDLIGISFPEDPLFTDDKDDIQINNEDGERVRLYKTKRSKYNLKEVIDSLANRYFYSMEIHIIQCKTNWNDNAQIPMLWDMIYSASGFTSSRIRVGQAARMIAYAKRFSYSFVTVPTVDTSPITPTSLQVLRVNNLSGGNYWGLPSKTGVADNVKEILTRNLSAGHTDPLEMTFDNELARTDFSSAYGYFML